MALKLCATIEGRTREDLEAGIEEVAKLVSGEYKSGGDHTDDARFNFDIVEVDEPAGDVALAGKGSEAS